MSEVGGSVRQNPPNGNSSARGVRKGSEALTRRAEWNKIMAFWLLAVFGFWPCLVFGCLAFGRFWLLAFCRLACVCF